MTSISERDRRVVWHPYTQMLTADPAIAIVHGEGVFLFDENGKKYIDAISSWWVNLHGHSHPYIAEKIGEQAKKLEQVIFAGFTHEGATELAERLLKILPSNQARIFYSDNGSTAVEVAVKMAWQFWKNKSVSKNTIIAFEDAYHGDTFGAMSVSGRGIFTKAFEPLLFDVVHIPIPDENNFDTVLSRLNNILSAGDVAAFIYEPLVLGAGGMKIYQPGHLEKLLELCKGHNVLCIADEVFTGFGRTGRLFASDYMKVKPDIMCLSKGITGGFLPMGVTTCTHEIYEAFLSEDRTKTLFHGHSYTANPLACAAALASMDLLLSDECRNNISRIEKQHLEFRDTISGHVSVQNARVQGTILAIDIQTEENASYLNKHQSFFYNYFLSKGVILRPLGNVIYCLPPYCIDDESLNYLYEIIQKAVDEFASK